MRQEYYACSVGLERFCFRIVERWNGECRIYIVDQPSYCGWPTDGHSTHRYRDDNGYFVCVRDDLIPTNFSHAKAWARYWAERTTDYIRTGRPFA